MPDSSTGGYLSPSNINGELNDQALEIFLQQVVVGITGMPGNMVRPRWQPEPPNIPDFGMNWASIGESEPRKRDSWAAVIRTPGGYGENPYGVSGYGDESLSIVIRNEILSILCSFYGPGAQANCELLAMGLALPQNREAMQLNGFGLVGGAGDMVTAPALLKDRWTYRVDLPFQLRRQQQYTYSILDLLGAEGTLSTDTTPPITEPFSVSTED